MNVEPARPTPDTEQMAKEPQFRKPRFLLPSPLTNTADYFRDSQILISNKTIGSNNLAGTDGVENMWAKC
jgi:hypothetical protein